MGRTALNAAVPNPFYGLITDPLATALNGPTVQRFRLLRPMPHFNGANVATSEPPIGDSSYHALQMKWDKRFSRGFSVLAHYTWSKMIDNGSHSSGNVSWLGGSTSVQNMWDLDAERSLSAHDVAHRVAVAGLWQLPFGRDARGVRTGIACSTWPWADGVSAACSRVRAECRSPSRNQEGRSGTAHSART